jgi:N-sulfoglucosamine sulfohydrolase
MKRIEFLKGTAAAALLPLLPFTASARASSGTKRVNLLFITADDMNWSMPGFMAGKHNLTPNLDNLEARSHRFIYNRSTVPICQPSRAAMMTGLVPHHSGALGFTPLHEGTPTLTTILKEQGYFTAGIHKLEHMQPPSCFPWDLKRPGEERNPLAYEGGVRDAISAARAHRKPFFINCNINDPHRPFYGSPEAVELDHNNEGPYKVMREVQPEDVEIPPFLEDLFDIRKELAQYWNSTQRLDVSIGKILAVLNESELEGNTVVVFSSDHGMPFPFSKATCYDSGTRTPVLLSWPEMGTARTFRDLTSNVDLLPTLLDILEIRPPPRLDGQSWLPIIQGRADRTQDHVITHVNTTATGTAYPTRAIQTMDYALIFSPWSDGTLALSVDSMSGLTYAAMVEAAKTSPEIAARVDQYTYGVPLAFYDLRADPGQRVNLIHRLEYRDHVADMMARLLRYMEHTTDPQLENFQILLAGGKPIVEQHPSVYSVTTP